MKNLLIIIGLFLLLTSGLALGQDEPAETAIIAETEQSVALDETVEAKDLGISEPKILPDSPLYFLKNWSRGIQNVLTFNPVKKAELRMKIANEKLLETRKIFEKTQNPDLIGKAVENYQGEIDRIKNQTEKIKEKSAENPQVDKFLDKFVHQQILQQKILEKLENQVPAEASKRIKEAREQHLEKFSEVMQKLEDKDKISGRLEKIIDEQKGSEFKNFKNLEILKKLEEKAPEESKGAIRDAQEKILKKFSQNLEQMTTEEQERFNNYLEKSGGDKKRQLEILGDLKTEISIKSELIEVPITPKLIELKKQLEKSGVNIMDTINKELENRNCPQWEKPAANFCPKGRIVIEEDEQGCPKQPKCIAPPQKYSCPEKKEIDCMPAISPTEKRYWYCSEPYHKWIKENC